jgi:hypothetical protein
MSGSASPLRAKTNTVATSKAINAAGNEKTKLSHGENRPRRNPGAMLEGLPVQTMTSGSEDRAKDILSL